MFNESIFKKIVTYELDVKAFFKSIENLDHNEYRKFRNDFLHFLVRNGLVADTESAKAKYWSRLLTKIKVQHNFMAPVSTSPSAIQKRYQRMD
jgi:hypothetical protein